ncbi:MAG: UDP-glucose/GDP-mannose dehydrogenase family protein [bacterium]|nr:MAG: UDP-glucose/GDP-mannose dehydrogenase family protein [bacterium]
MKVNVFGLGYVGCVTAACLARDGHDVVGYDIDEVKVKLINDGKSPMVEDGLDQIIQESISVGNLSAEMNHFRPADISVVCVGTPSCKDGSLNLEYVKKVTQQIGGYIRESPDYHILNNRSTVLPGTIETEIVPLIEKISGKTAGQDFGVSMNPEFLREGSSIFDYYHPPFTVIGSNDSECAEKVGGLYELVDAPLIYTDIKVAEMVKYASNAFHALKISFANEIGNYSKKVGLDSHKVMEIFCKDTKLNLSPYYLKPGFAFGGSCLPKDVRALLSGAKDRNLELPVLDSILVSNQKQVQLAFDLIAANNEKKIGLVGLSFKSGTDDLRESPLVTLTDKLIRSGFSVLIFDQKVSLSRLRGANRRYIESTIPHISSLLKSSLNEVIENSQVIVLGNKISEDKINIKHRLSGKAVIDLVRFFSPDDQKDFDYEGICW